MVLFGMQPKLVLSNMLLLWLLEGGPGPWHLFDEAALWILPSGLNLETVKCKEKNSETSFTYQEWQFVCHLVDLLLNSKPTCFNSIQSAKLCNKRGKWFCFLFEALNSENIVMKIKNKLQSFVFCRKFYIFLQTELSFNMWIMNQVIFHQEEYNCNSM